MKELAKKATSYWLDSTPETNYPTLIDNTLVDVAIVGAGIAGLTAAYLLKSAGKTVAVIDAAPIVKGTSAHTTAKVTSLHQLIYAELIEKFGEEKAKIYADANQAAIKQIAAIIEKEQIDCDFSYQTAYTFADTTDKLEKVEAEVKAAQKLGLPAHFVRETSLPFLIAGAIALENQAQFHVRKYLLHLAQTIPGNGSYVFENSRVNDVKNGKPCQVMTDKGVLRAKDVIIATNLPILDRGLYFAKTYPKRSYIVGARIDPAKAPQGMYIGFGDNYFSIRTTPDEQGLLLLVGGGGHKVGEKTDTESVYTKIESYVREKFGIDRFEYRWSTQDVVSFDKVPYIGKLTPWEDHLYVTTGFSLWGMTTSVVSAMILTDTILGVKNPWLSLYDSTRATPFVSPKSVQENLNVGTHWVGDRLKGLMGGSLADLKNDEGKVIKVDGDKVAAYKDPEGNLHTVSAVCTHLGCIVNWNSAEKSWDCPCHGARFNCEGKVLHGPAIKDLEKK